MASSRAIEYSRLPSANVGKALPLEPKRSCHEFAPILKASHQHAAAVASMPGMLRTHVKHAGYPQGRDALASGTANYIKGNSLAHVHSMEPKITAFRKEDELLATPHSGMNMGSRHNPVKSLASEPRLGITGTHHTQPKYQAPGVVAGGSQFYHSGLERQAAVEVGGSTLWNRAHNKVHAAHQMGALRGMSHSASTPVFARSGGASPPMPVR